MKYDIVLAGVGGQGILTIAKALSMAAMAKGFHVKQAEVHGMSQRGGAVYSHVRISDSEIFSDLIPAGQADMVLAVEPLEALRYVSMLKADGAVVTGTSAVANIADYPSVSEVLRHVGVFNRHIAIDMDRLARAAGSILAANIVALGAASHFLHFSPQELEDVIGTMFEAKGQRIVDANLRGFRFGRNAAGAYLAALAQGARQDSVRSWIESLPADALADADALEFPESHEEDSILLTSAESSAFESVLLEAYDEGRKQLYEHEVYSLLELVGAISAPRHLFVPKGSTVDEDQLARIPGSRVVLKLVSQDVVHKSDVGAVVFVSKDLDLVRSELDRLVARHSDTARVAGTLLVEFVEHDHRGLGGELFVGIRSTREFGPVIAAGLGGLDTEYLASKLRPGLAVAKALAMDTDAESFLDEFRSTVAYDVLSGSVRGHERVVSDGELLKCFRAFIGIARRFCVDRGEQGPDIGELEVNPFAFREQRLMPLDGRGRLRPATAQPAATDLQGVERMLLPETIAVAGVSSNPESLGRTILAQIQASGYDPSALTVIKEGEKEIGGAACVPSFKDLDSPVDLLVVAAPASGASEIVEAAAASGMVRSGIVIAGGAGETPESEPVGAALRAAMARGEGGPAFLGPNCMGIRSLPGKYDTFFVPEDRLPSRRGMPVHPVALLSQSGAFAVSRLSTLDWLNPAFTVSFGNQYDVTLGDLLEVLLERDDVRVAALYVEGFADLDGIRVARLVQRWTAEGKSVVLYKGGRTEHGRAAAAGHTAAVAGDYDICLTAFENSGALIARNLREFNDLLGLALALDGVEAGGGRVFAVTNAGVETVAIGDSLGEADPDVGLVALGSDLKATLEKVISEDRLNGLVAARNPLDLTPMAGEATYAKVVQAALDCPDVDALLVSCVPLSPKIATFEGDLKGGFPKLAVGWKAQTAKPVVCVMDSGAKADPLATAVREKGIAVFRSADEAARALAVWLSAKRRAKRIEPVEQPQQATPVA